MENKLFGCEELNPAELQQINGGGLLTNIIKDIVGNSDAGDTVTGLLVGETRSLLESFIGDIPIVGHLFDVLF